MAQEKAERPKIDVGRFKDLAGVSPQVRDTLLEYLDREHVTRRSGDARVITLSLHSNPQLPVAPGRDTPGNITRTLWLGLGPLASKPLFGKLQFESERRVNRLVRLAKPTSKCRSTISASVKCFFKRMKSASLTLCKLRVSFSA